MIFFSFLIDAAPYFLVWNIAVVGVFFL